MDYRGEIGVILINLSNEEYVIEPHERIAQIVIATYSQVIWDPCLFLSDTERGEGGFSSTGKK